MEIDDYDVSYSSICNRINGNPQQAKKELLRLCSMTIKVEEKAVQFAQERDKKEIIDAVQKTFLQMKNDTL